MKQTKPTKPAPNPGKSRKPAVATRNLVTIGQVWERKSRSQDKEQIRIVQVHRADQQVEAIILPVQRIGFTDLRSKYRLTDKKR